DGTNWYDFEYNGVQASASALFTAVDINGVACSVQYDISVPGATTASDLDWAAHGVTPWASWELILSDGRTDCDVVDPAVWGSDDPRDAIEMRTWHIAFAPVSPGAAWFGADPNE